jgi:D-alanyl-D-alanine carboxypeptidase/D-alanyl-D-alanine-endopeptidase (penicillin-binding protein 4)
MLLLVPSMGVAAAMQEETAAAAAHGSPASRHATYPTGDTTQTGSQVAAIVAEPGVARARWGIAVTTLNGTPIYGLNEGQFFQPASNAKLFTTSAAMALLGGSATVETKVVGRGQWQGAAKLTGNLVIVGGADANLNGRELPYVSAVERAARRKAGVPAPPKADALRYLAAMADQVAATGLKEIQGDIVGDDTLFPWEPYAPDWAIDDTTWYYGAPVSALMVDDDQIDVVVYPGKAVGEPPRVTVTPAEPAYYALDLSGLKTGAAKSASHVDFDLPLGSRTLRIYGSLAVDAAPDAEGIAIHDPAVYAAMAFKQMLEARDVTVSGTARAEHRAASTAQEFLSESLKPLHSLILDEGAVGGYGAGRSPMLYSCDHCDPATLPVERELARHTSPTLAEDIVLTNKVSQNQHAELMLHRLGVVLGAEGAANGSGAEGVRVVRQFLVQAGLDPGDFVFYDGSGLSGHDLVTPRATAQLLRFAATQPWFAAWKASLPVAGEDGTLAARFPKAPLKDHLFAKTGTLGEARALSGYVEAASGQTLIFSVMVNAHSPATNTDRDAMDRMVAAIAAAN